MTATVNPAAIARAHDQAVEALGRLKVLSDDFSEAQQRLVHIAEIGLGVLEARVAIDLTHPDTLLTSVFRQIEHEVRTPLMSTLGAVEMLDDGDAGVLTGDAKVAAEVTLGAVQNLVTLVNEFLAELANTEPLEGLE